MVNALASGAVEFHNSSEKDFLSENGDTKKIEVKDECYKDIIKDPL